MGMGRAFRDELILINKLELDNVGRMNFEFIAYSLQTFYSVFSRVGLIYA